MNFIKNILNFLHPDSVRKDSPIKNDEVPDTVCRMTNNIFYQELINHFKMDMEELSVGRRILYPMSFNILLHPDDYDRVKESFSFILPEVIAGFYAAIKQKIGGRTECDATNPATYWFFQIAASEWKSEGTLDLKINPGDIVTVSHLTNFDIKAQQGVHSTDTRLSIKCNNSNVNATNLNKEALKGMEILTNNAFSFNFLKNMSEKLADIEDSRRGNNYTLATLTYSDGKKKVSIPMLDDIVTISGPKETREMDNILIINNDAVEIGHVQIRYLKEENKFQLCAYAPTRLSMKEVPLSFGGAPDWKNMAYHCNIFLNSIVNITFEASDRIRNRDLISR